MIKILNRIIDDNLSLIPFSSFHRAKHSGIVVRGPSIREKTCAERADVFIITCAQKSITPKISGSTGGEIRGRYYKEALRWRARYKKPFISRRARIPFSLLRTLSPKKKKKRKNEEDFNKSRRALNYSSSPLFFLSR